MRKFETRTTGLALLAAAVLLPAATLEPMGLAGDRSRSGSLTATFCDDGSAHLAMGCASISL